MILDITLLHSYKSSIQGMLFAIFYIYKTPDLWSFVKLARLLMSLSREGKRQNGENFWLCILFHYIYSNKGTNNIQFVWYYRTPVIETKKRKKLVSCWQTMKTGFRCIVAALLSMFSVVSLQTFPSSKCLCKVNRVYVLSELLALFLRAYDITLNKFTTNGKVLCINLFDNFIISLICRS